MYSEEENNNFCNFGFLTNGGNILLNKGGKYAFFTPSGVFI